MTISEYIESLAEKFLGHSSDSCHFSDASVFSTRVPRVMKYPCVGMDTEGWVMTGAAGADMITFQLNLYFLSHVRDTGSFEALEKCFQENFRNAMIFLGTMAKDKKAMKVPAMNLDISSCEGTRIEFKDAALYGYAVGINASIPFEWMVCQMTKEESMSL